MVSACKKKDTGRLYALKIMDKKRVKINKISFYIIFINLIYIS